MPDWFFVGTFLGKPERAACDVVLGLAYLLDRIMRGVPADAKEGEACAVEDSKEEVAGTRIAGSTEARPEGAGVKRGADEAAGETAGAAGALGCSGSPSNCATCGGGESVEQRRVVCERVLEHLYSGQTTGRPELDAVAAVTKAFGIQRDLFEQYCDALADEQNLRRYATWQRARSVCERSAGTLARIVWRIVSPVRESGSRGPAAAVEEARPEGPDLKTRAEAQFLALAIAIRWIGVLHRVGADWSNGILRLPMDDLVHCGLTPADIAVFSAECSRAGVPQVPDGLKNPASDSRSDDSARARAAKWAAMVELQGERVEKLLDGAEGCLPDMPPGSRRAAAVAIELARGRLMRWYRAGGAAFAAVPPTGATMSQRLSRVPAAMRLLARAGK